jgi:dihydroflavonol-4-reductase
MILDFIRGRMPAYVNTSMNIICADDVARGHLLAEELGRPGERYILAGEDWSLEEILDTLASISGRLTPRVAIPRFVALCAGYLDNLVMGTLLRREPNIPLDAVRLAGCRNYVSGEKARRELGCETTPVEQGLREAVEYFLYEWQPDSTHDRVSNLRPKAV